MISGQMGRGAQRRDKAAALTASLPIAAPMLTGANSTHSPGCACLTVSEAYDEIPQRVGADRHSADRGDAHRLPGNMAVYYDAALRGPGADRRLSPATARCRSGRGARYRDQSGE